MGREWSWVAGYELLLLQMVCSVFIIIVDKVFRHKHVEPPKPGEELSCGEIELINRLIVTFVTPDGDRTTLQVREGDSLLDIAHEHDIDLEGTP